jgi:hypothetical protein
MAFYLGGFTLPINWALRNNGYQTTSGELGATVNHSPAVAVANLSSDACSQLKSSYLNAMVYIIKYKTTASVPASNLPNAKTYSANSEADLNATLQEIAEDIKSAANAKDGRVIQDETPAPPPIAPPPTETLSDPAASPPAEPEPNNN